MKTLLGANIEIRNNQQGVSFALYSSQAQKIELCLFDSEDNEKRFAMEKNEQDIWHCWIANIEVGTKYGYRLYPKYGVSLNNPNKLMLDPYAKMVVGKPDLSTANKRAWFLLSDQRDNAKLAPKAMVTHSSNFDWQGDKPLQTPWEHSIIYELHVKGFTQLREDLPQHIRGTYAGLAHPKSIAYLQSLGITAVELLPVNFFVNEPHLQEKRLSNYWGYNPLAMFALEPSYAATDNPMNEFKQAVKALHQAGIEVILDVVFNHTAEGEKDYPTFSQRGIDDQTYYYHDQQGYYYNWTGCGNTLDLSSPQARAWALDCLKYWVKEYHIDGFRFDLATCLGREQPYFNPQGLLFKAIENDPILSRCKMISEPWDLGDGGYQVGNFPSYFAEWNDRYRDDIKRFWLWKSGALGDFAERLAGSSDIYRKGNQLPYKTLNFITAHDGFTLRDLVSYNHKHNFANGEDNRDGRNENYSYNHGIEGLAEGLPVNEKSAVEKQRFLTSVALLRTLLLSNGTPMLLAGDEFGNTQYGNNNAYCQDNQISWLKWRNFNEDLFVATQQAIQLRKKIQSLTMGQWWSAANVSWLNEFGHSLQVADWQDYAGKAMQFLLDDQWLFVINAKDELQNFVLPDGKWEMLVSSHSKMLKGQGLVVETIDFCLLQRK
ncbi:glycogen debranching protein GlgX [Lonepinella sp. MS14437]|uniref:glycogen debranching protein GlgX n=1 Tax=Lonepinella sp. MS14437 TaxID=3003620 RepID=UPI0036D86C19